MIFFADLRMSSATIAFGKTISTRSLRRSKLPQRSILLFATATKLKTELSEVDMYSAALIGAIRTNPGWPWGHPIGDCEEPLDRLLLALRVAKGKIEKANKEGGRPRSIARKVGLSQDLQAICNDFSIKPAPKDFDACLYLILESAGETTGMKDDTISKLAQKTRKRKK